MGKAEANLERLSISHPYQLRDRSKRTCAGCGQVKECNLAEGGAEWYRRRRLRTEVIGDGVVHEIDDVIPSSYCRALTRSRETRRRGDVGG
jgi:hypothetical protein